MRLMNSFQLVAVFAFLPFLISWLSDQSFRWHGAAFWTAIVTYVAAFFVQWCATYDGMRKDGPFDW